MGLEREPPEGVHLHPTLLPLCAVDPAGTGAPPRGERVVPGLTAGAVLERMRADPRLAAGATLDLLPARREESPEASLDGFFAAVTAAALAPPAARPHGIWCPAVGLRCPGRPGGRRSLFDLLYVVHSGEIFAADIRDKSYVVQLF